MKIHLTLAKTLDGEFLQPVTEVVQAKSILGALQEYSYRTGTNWRLTSYGWYRKRDSLAHLYLSESLSPPPPLPKVRVFNIEEYFLENGEVDFSYMIPCRIVALSEVEAVANLRKNTKERNARLNLPTSAFVRTYDRGWVSKYIKLVITEE